MLIYSSYSCSHTNYKIILLLIYRIYSCSHTNYKIILLLIYSSYSCSHTNYKIILLLIYSSYSCSHTNYKIILLLIYSSYEKKDWTVIINNFININKNEQLPYFWFIHSHIKSFFTIISIVNSNLCSNLSMTQYHIICLNYCINYDKIRLKHVVS